MSYYCNHKMHNPELAILSLKPDLTNSFFTSNLRQEISVMNHSELDNYYNLK